MSRFTAPLVVTPLNDGKTWKVLHSSSSGPQVGAPDTFEWKRRFGYDVGEEGSCQSITVHSGFITDFASIPGPMRGVLRPWGKYGNASVIHDYLYRNGVVRERRSDGSNQPKFLNPSRKTADQIFLEAMGVSGTPWWQKRMIYAAVRVGGWWAWNKNRA